MRRKWPTVIVCWIKFGVSRGGPLAILVHAEAAGDLRSALGAIREGRSTLELIAKVTGELRDKGRTEVPMEIHFVIGRICRLAQHGP